MQTIWKFTLTSDCIIEIPSGAQILTVQEQYGQPQMWALVDPSNSLEKRRFLVFGTGHQIDKIITNYIGTFQLNAGTFIFHVFEGSI